MTEYEKERRKHREQEAAGVLWADAALRGARIVAHRIPETQRVREEAAEVVAGEQREGAVHNLTTDARQ